jgi:hypothetical protein
MAIGQRGFWVGILRSAWCPGPSEPPPGTAPTKQPKVQCRELTAHQKMIFKACLIESLGF